MAKASAVKKNKKRINMSNRLFKKRKELKNIDRNKKITLEERLKEQQKL